jgi:hypothetical protein
MLAQLGPDPMRIRVSDPVQMHGVVASVRTIAGERRVVPKVPFAG